MAVTRVELDVKDDDRLLLTVYERTPDGTKKTVVDVEEGTQPSVALDNYLNP